MTDKPRGSMGPTDERYRRFAKAYVFGPNYGRVGRCVREAFGESGSSSANDRRLGNFWMKKPAVQRYIEEERQRLAEERCWTFDHFLHMVRQIKEAAMNGGDLRVAIKAIELMGKAAGLTDRQQAVDEEYQTPEELIRELAEIVRRNPGHLKLLLEELGVEPRADPGASAGQRGRHVADAAGEAPPSLALERASWGETRVFRRDSEASPNDDPGPDRAA